MTSRAHRGIALWAVTPNGARLARSLARQMADATVFLTAKLTGKNDTAIAIDRFRPAVEAAFADFSGHVFVMATGIVVRTIAPQLAHKTTDPAVVVCDEAGKFAVSLVAGHVGGANALARKVARILDAQAVITTATDVNRVPAIDVIAVENGLAIETPDTIKLVNMALITGAPIQVHDPYARVTPLLPAEQVVPAAPQELGSEAAAVYVDHTRLDLPAQVLILRPASLVAGMGCNRGTALQEMAALLVETFARNRLAIGSLRAVATVDLKADEPGLRQLAAERRIPLETFTRDQLNQVAHIPSPSAVVEKHIGVKSVCEAAALLATCRGRLIVPKQKTKNVTLAIAADGFTSSVSAPARGRI